MNDHERGERALKLLEDAVFQQAVSDASDFLLTEWTTCQDAVERDALWHRFHALDGVPRQLRIYVDRAKRQETRSG